MVSADAPVSLGFPLVVKPADGGGGLGVFLVESPEDVPVALNRVAWLRNDGGGEFPGLLVEQFLSGTEFSLQGVVRDSKVVIFTTCEKVIAREPVAGAAALKEFQLSGGAVAGLVCRTTGTDWAEVTFCTHLGGP